MGATPQDPSRTAGQACWEIRRDGMILPEPKFELSEKALQPVERLRKMNKPNQARITEAQSKTLHEGRCCDCEGQLLAGPRGGLCRNMKCKNCGHEFNIGPVTAERI